MTALKRLLSESRKTKERLTLRKLAERVPCSVGHLSGIVNGKAVPSLRIARRLSEETGLPLEVIVREAA